MFKKLLLLALALAGSALASANAQVIVGSPCTGVFCSATAPLAPNLGGTGQNNFAATGVPLWTSGVYSVLGTTGTGNVLRDTGPTIGTSLTLSYAAGSGARCLHVDNAGVVTIASADCNTGGGGAVSSVFGRTGAVVAATNDYSIGQIGGLGTGVATFLGTPSSANLAATVTGETGSGALVFGTAPSIASPAFSGTATGVSGAILDALGSTQGQILYRNATSWVPLAPGTNGQVLTTGGAAANPSWQTVTGGTGCTTTGSSILQGNGSGGCSNVTLGSGLSLSSGTLSLATTLRANTGTTDTILASDGGKVYSTSNASAQAITLPTVGTTGFGAGFGFNPDAIGAGTATITSASNIDGLGSIALTTGQGASIYSDGTTYHAIVGQPQIANNRLFGNNSGATSYGNSLTGAQAWTIISGSALSTAQTWTAAQRNSITTLTPSANTYTPNFDSSNNFTLTLAATNTIANPSTTPVAGQSGIIEIIQDATGSRTVTWGSQYVAAGGVSTVTLSTAANAKDYISYYVVDATHILISAGALNAVH